MVPPRGMVCPPSSSRLSSSLTRFFGNRRRGIFFFQAEDGIRDGHVTGVQTCALPIWGPRGGMVMCGAAHAQALDKTVMPGVQGGPLMHVIADKGVAFKEALTPEWRRYQGQVIQNARALADALMVRGYRLVSGGTDTHLILVDLSSRNITGKDAQEALDRAWITVNKNTVPFETKSPMVTSGIRIGTPA